MRPLALLVLLALPSAAQVRHPDRLPDCDRVADRLGLSDAERDRMCGGRAELPPVPGRPRRPSPGTPAEPLRCVERCQRYDDWGKCEYRTKCERTEDCVTETVCDRFDDWGKCLSEATKASCRSGGRRPVSSSCEARCQRYDDWGKCLHMPSCSWDGECWTRTACEKFDDWGKCLFEGAALTCPSFGRGRRPVACTESCQRYDDWGKCLYRTRCEKDGACLRRTACERFDDWGACLGETAELVCG